MILRRAKLSDMPELEKLGKKFRDYIDMVDKNDKAVYDQRRWVSDIKEKWRDYVKNKIRANNAQVNICEIDGHIVGYSLVSIKKNSVPVFNVKKLGYFGDLYVDDKYRQRGIATKLKDMGLEYFREKGIKHFSIQVSPNNDIAHKIYQKWGFFDYHLELRK